MKNRPATRTWSPYLSCNRWRTDLQHGHGLHILILQQMQNRPATWTWSPHTYPATDEEQTCNMDMVSTYLSCNRWRTDLQHGHGLHILILQQMKNRPATWTWSPHTYPATDAEQTCNMDMVSTYLSCNRWRTDLQHWHGLHILILQQMKNRPATWTWSPHTYPATYLSTAYHSESNSSASKTFSVVLAFERTYGEKIRFKLKTSPVEFLPHHMYASRKSRRSVFIILRFAIQLQIFQSVGWLSMSTRCFKNHLQNVQCMERRHSVRLHYFQQYIVSVPLKGFIQFQPTMKIQPSSHSLPNEIDTLRVCWNEVSSTKNKQKTSQVSEK